MDQDEEYFIPLQDQRVFGAGIKRKLVQFVPSAGASTPDATTSVVPERAAGSYYQSLVFPAVKETPDPSRTESSTPPPKESESSDLLCEICKLPLQTACTTKPHEASLAHQACLAHSHPPSHLDRHHRGLQYLSSYGWDPDSRQGLGASGEGRRFPIKAQVKNDTTGVGFRLPKSNSSGLGGGKAKVEKLNAKQVRQRDDDRRKKAARLQQLFYQSEELNRYLGVED